MPDNNPQAIQAWLDEHPELPESQRAFFAAAASPEPLDPELAAYIDEDGPLGPMIRHPLVFDPTGMATPGLPNRQLRWKKKALAEALSERDWYTAVFLHERPYRADALWQIARDHADEISDTGYWELVGAVWTDSENIWQNEAEWEELLHADRPERQAMMDDDEREMFAVLPEVIEVWRGCIQGQNEDGLSWTTDRERARWFARRFADNRDGDPIVLHGTVAKEQVVAYFAGRNESEIVVAEPGAVSFDEIVEG